MTKIPAWQEHLLISYHDFRGRQPDLVPCFFPANVKAGYQALEVVVRFVATARAGAAAAARACLSEYMRASA